MLRRSLIFGLIPLALACGEKEPGEDSGDLIIDEDGDGVAAEDDCDDDDANVFPGSGYQAHWVTVEVCIDGSDWLHLAGATAWWVHRAYDLPGEHDSCNGFSDTLLDNIGWDPSFSGNTSDVFSLLPSPGPVADATIVLSPIQGRGAVTVVQHPNAGNGYEASILFDDDPQSAADVYEVEVLYTCDP